jgi:hypothetical protein
MRYTHAPSILPALVAAYFGGKTKGRTKGRYDDPNRTKRRENEVWVRRRDVRAVEAVDKEEPDGEVRSLEKYNRRVSSRGWKMILASREPPSPPFCQLRTL